MARAVAAAMQADESLLFEAGTGVGKSSPPRSRNHPRRRSHAPADRLHPHDSLQEQLEGSDLRSAAGCSKQPPNLRAMPTSSQRAGGQGNYLCTTRLAHALADRGTLLSERISTSCRGSRTGRPPARPAAARAQAATAS